MIGFRVSFVCFAFALSGSFAWADVVFDGRFNTGNFSHYRLETNGVGYSDRVPPHGVPGHLERVLDPAGSGELVALATRATGDAPTHGGYRSEMSAPTDPVGSERWYSWGYYLPDTGKDVKNDAVIAQIHDMPDAGESDARDPTLALWIQGDKLKLINSFDYDRITSLPSTPSIRGVDYERRELTSWGLETGRWTYLDLHVKWAGDDSGFLEFWKDGVLHFQERNHINTFDDERGVWFKNGLYDWSSNSKDVSTYSTGVMVGDEKETLQSMTMSMIPEPSAYLMMLAGLVGIGLIATRGSRYPALKSGELNT